MTGMNSVGAFDPNLTTVAVNTHNAYTKTGIQTVGQLGQIPTKVAANTHIASKMRSLNLVGAFYNKINPP